MSARYEVRVSVTSVEDYIVTVEADDAEHAREQVNEGLFTDDVTDFADCRKLGPAEWLSDDIGEPVQV